MTIIESLRQFITVQLLNSPDMQIANDDDLLISGLLDSLGIMRLIGYIEDELNIEVPPEEVTLENFGTLQDMHNFLSAASAAA